MSSAARVIVGAGQAGAWVARTLRTHGFGGPIVLIGEEPHWPYERPPLSKAVLMGAAHADTTTSLGADDAGRLGITGMLGSRVVALDRARRLVWCEDGRLAEYETLFLTMGGVARMPQGVRAGPRVRVLRTRADADALRAALSTARSLLVLGGGWIGLEVAAAARGMGLEVTVLERDDGVCRRSLPPVAGAFLRRLHESRGTRFVFGATLGAVNEDADGVTVDVSGTTLRANLLVAGIGIAPANGLAREAGLAIAAGGILVDAAGRTSDPAIFAAGDVAAHHNGCAGGVVRLESWANAQDQAIAAARASLGIEAAYDPVPWFWSDQFGVNIQMCGCPERGVVALRRGDPDGGSGCWLLLDGAGRAVGGVAINAPRELRALRRALAANEAPSTGGWTVAAPFDVARA